MYRAAISRRRSVQRVMCLSFTPRMPAWMSSSRLLKPKLWTERAVEPWLRSLRTAASMSSRSVTTAPPSPGVPRFFWMMKLVHTASLSWPCFQPGP